MVYNAIRFISREEKELLDKKGMVEFRNQQKPWNDHGTLYFFVIGEYTKEDYIPVIQSLAKYNNIQYDYIAYLNFEGYSYKYPAAYDKEQVDNQTSKQLPFEIDSSTYATGPIYIVPEYRRTWYGRKQVVKVEEFKVLVENKNKEAINNMPENKEKEIREEIKQDLNQGPSLGVDLEDTEQTFMKMYLELVDGGAVNEAVFRQALNKIDFKEEIGYTYAGADLRVESAYIPVITGGVADVKVVKVEQGNNIGLIVPVEVAYTYRIIEEDPGVVSTLNNIKEVAFETFGFNTNDEALIELVAELYINSENKGLPYILRGETEVEVKEKEAEQEEVDFLNSEITRGAGDENAPMFNAIEEPIETIEDIDLNLESFKKFRKTNKSLNLLEKSIWEQVPNIVKENVRTKYIANGNILAIQVNNRNIYETFSNLPGHAKKLLTTIGESIKANKGTQLVDSINNKGKRLFILAENNNNNFWVVKGENLALLETANKNHTTIIPDSREVITLNKTHIRAESRTRIPYKHGKQIAFVEKNKVIK